MRDYLCGSLDLRAGSFGLKEKRPHRAEIELDDRVILRTMDAAEFWNCQILVEVAVLRSSNPTLLRRCEFLASPVIRERGQTVRPRSLVKLRTLKLNAACTLGMRGHTTSFTTISSLRLKNPCWIF